MLEIDFVTILFQILNFVVLAVALYFLLFKRMIQKGDQRKAEAEAVRQESLQNLEESRQLRAEAQAYVDSINQMVDEHIEKAKQEIEQHREEVLQATREEAEGIYKQRKEDTIRTQKRTVEKFRKEILDTIGRTFRDRRGGADRHRACSCVEHNGFHRIPASEPHWWRNEIR